VNNSKVTLTQWLYDANDIPVVSHNCRCISFNHCQMQETRTKRLILITVEWRGVLSPAFCSIFFPPLAVICHFTKHSYERSSLC